MIDYELESMGTAQVIVFVRQPLAAGSTRLAAEPDIAKYFVSSPVGPASAIQKAEAFAYKLGSQADLALGLFASTGPRRRRRQKSAVAPYRFYPRLRVAFGTVDEKGLSGLRNHNQVEEVVEAPALTLVHPQEAVTVGFRIGLTWGLRALNIPGLWSEGLSGKDVLIGHLDTGVDANHPVLKSAVSFFADFDSLGVATDPAPSPYDSQTHGTHTAATIAGRPWKGRSVGVAPRAELASAIVIEGGLQVARILGGLEWAITSGVRVLSLSLGFVGWNPSFRLLVQRIRDQDIVPIFAIGNEGPGSSRSPGNYEESFSVGACDKRLRVPWFSSSQRFVRSANPVVPEVIAPGVRVVSARAGGGWTAMSGTSMATPHVAGLAALLREAKPAASALAVEAAIRDSCIPVPEIAAERVARGFPDGVRALQLLRARVP